MVLFLAAVEATNVQNVLKPHRYERKIEQVSNSKFEACLLETDQLIWSDRGNSVGATSENNKHALWLCCICM